MSDRDREAERDEFLAEVQSTFDKAAWQRWFQRFLEREAYEREQKRTRGME
jgi:hypothetical protein